MKEKTFENPEVRATVAKKGKMQKKKARLSSVAAFAPHFPKILIMDEHAMSEEEHRMFDKFNLLSISDHVIVWGLEISCLNYFSSALMMTAAWTN
ncbi:hypothetical protein M5689_009267 [Euphorbia peplus]|nr:hypothetical protein M5689_009267 [Euphorbia peplus]